MLLEALSTWIFAACRAGAEARHCDCDPAQAPVETICGAQRVYAGLRMHRVHTDIPQFRRLSEMLEYWRSETLAQAQQWPDAGLVREGLRLWEALGKPLPTDVLLATDLHEGNVLQSEREPWLIIDPKPFIGDPAYDVVQHLHNCEARLRADAVGLLKRLADLCEVDQERLRLCTLHALPPTPGQTGATHYASMSVFWNGICAIIDARPPPRCHIQPVRKKASANGNVRRPEP